MSQERFFSMLERVPRIRHLWARERGLRSDLFESELGVLSQGEAHMARFFISVWWNGNRNCPEAWRFDLVDALSSIDPEHAELIAEWMKNPFWP